MKFLSSAFPPFKEVIKAALMACRTQSFFKKNPPPQYFPDFPLLSRLQKTKIIGICCKGKKKEGEIMHVSRPCKEGKGKNRTTKKREMLLRCLIDRLPPFSHTPFFPPADGYQSGIVSKRKRKENGKTLPSPCTSMSDMRSRKRFFNGGRETPGLA